MLTGFGSIAQSDCNTISHTAPHNPLFFCLRAPVHHHPYYSLTPAPFSEFSLDCSDQVSYTVIPAYTTSKGTPFGVWVRHSPAVFGGVCCGMLFLCLCACRGSIPTAHARFALAVYQIEKYAMFILGDASLLSRLSEHELQYAQE